MTTRREWFRLAAGSLTIIFVPGHRSASAWRPGFAARSQTISKRRLPLAKKAGVGLNWGSALDAHPKADRSRVAVQ
jgi:hypothetical protein